MVAAREGAAGVPVERLLRLRRDVQSTRLALRRVRANAQAGEDVRKAQQELVAALRLYIDALESLGLPIPYTLRDELRIYRAVATTRTRCT
jgi:predicted RNase H-like HicB family nuclease